MLVPEVQKDLHLNFKDNCGKSQITTRLNWFAKVKSVIIKVYPKISFNVVPVTMPNASISTTNFTIKVNEGLIFFPSMGFEGLLVLMTHEINHLEPYGAGTYLNNKYCEKDCDYYGPKLILRKLLSEAEITEEFKKNARDQIKIFLKDYSKPSNEVCGYGTNDERLLLFWNGLNQNRRDALVH